MRYTLGVVALLEACDGFYQELEIGLKLRETFNFFCDLHEK